MDYFSLFAPPDDKRMQEAIQQSENRTFEKISIIRSLFTVERDMLKYYKILKAREPQQIQIENRKLNSMKTSFFFGKKQPQIKKSKSLGNGCDLAFQKKTSVPLSMPIIKEEDLLQLLKSSLMEQFDRSVSPDDDSEEEEEKNLKLEEIKD